MTDYPLADETGRQMGLDRLSRSSSGDSSKSAASCVSGATVLSSLSGSSSGASSSSSSSSGDNSSSNGADSSGGAKGASGSNSAGSSSGFKGASTSSASSASRNRSSTHPNGNGSNTEFLEVCVPTSSTSPLASPHSSPRSAGGLPPSESGDEANNDGADAGAGPSTSTSTSSPSPPLRPRLWPGAAEVLILSEASESGDEADRLGGRSSSDGSGSGGCGIFHLLPSSGGSRREATAAAAAVAFHRGNSGGRRRSDSNANSDTVNRRSDGGTGHRGFAPFGDAASDSDGISVSGSDGGSISDWDSLLGDPEPYAGTVPRASAPGHAPARPASASATLRASAPADPSGRLWQGPAPPAAPRRRPTSAAHASPCARATGLAATAPPGSLSALAGALASSSSSFRRRAAFVAGSVRVPPRPLEPASTAARDILLPRLPAPALERIVPALGPATRAALRASCRAMRSLVDAHTDSLTLRPNRATADSLARRGLKAYGIFPALRHATVILAGDALTPPTAAAAANPAAAAAAAAAPQGAAAQQAQQAQAQEVAAAAGGRRPGGSGAPPLPPPPSPPLPLAGWLVCCGTASRLTSLCLHTADVGSLEELGLALTHPHLERLDLRITRCGAAHTTPPLVSFGVGALRRLAHLRIAAAGPGGAAAGLAAAAHGPRRLFLDGRPALGPRLLAGLADLPRLQSLELEGFHIEPDAAVALARAWGPGGVAARLRRLCLNRLHMRLPPAELGVPPLCELLARCAALTDLSADVSAPGLAGGGGGGLAALTAALYASRDTAAVLPMMLPASLTRLRLPGVVLAEPEDLQALARLRALVALEVTALGPGAAQALPSLQELRLSGCTWQQVVNMLPWAAPARTARGAQHAQRRPRQQQQQQRQQAVPQGAAQAATAGSESAAVAGGAAARGAGAPARALRLLEVEVCERLDDWHPPDRRLLGRVAKRLLPLADGGCRLRLNVAPDAQPHIWNESDVDGRPWEPAAVWRGIQAAQHRRRLQAETVAVTERMARGRLLQAARRREKEQPFVDR